MISYAYVLLVATLALGCSIAFSGALLAMAEVEAGPRFGAELKVK